MANCSNCGFSLQPGDARCPKCGAQATVSQGSEPPVSGQAPPQVVYAQPPQVVYVTAPPQQSAYNPNLPKKSKIVAGILAFFLGGLGIHKFYLGSGIGVLYLLFCWTFLPSFIAFIEAIIYLTSSDENFDRKYNPQCFR